MSQEFNELIRNAFTNKAEAKELNEKYGFKGIPMDPNYSLYDYQIQTILFMKKQENKDSQNNFGIHGGIISLQMGLGKTLIGLAYSLLNRKKCPTLIVCSKTVLLEWKSNATKFFGDRIKFCIFHKDFTDCEKFNTLDIFKYDIIITTYECCASAFKKGEYKNKVHILGDRGLHKGKVIQINRVNEKPELTIDSIGYDLIYNIPWERVIFDESQRFSNWKSGVFSAVMAIYANYRWCLTGTPIKNTDLDMWSQLRVLGFDAIERAKIWNSGRFGYHFYIENNIGNSVLQMSYDEANMKMPNKSIIEEYVILQERDKNIYLAVLDAMREQINIHIQNRRNFANVLAMFIRLRQCCISPYLVKDMSIFANIEWIRDINEAYKSPKIVKIIDTISSIKDEKKIVIFSSFAKALELASGALSHYRPDIKHTTLTGDIKDKESVLNKFKKDSTVKVLFITMGVGSEGLTLTEADSVMCIEPWWNDAKHRQAEGRCWRIGQKNNVNIVEILVDRTIEMCIKGIRRRKSVISSNFLNKRDDEVEESSTLTFENLIEIINEGQIQ